MSYNLPPGVSIGDPNAPWNQPDMADLLPLTCNECGFTAETLREMTDHMHDDESFAPEPPDNHADHPDSEGSHPIRRGVDDVDDARPRNGEPQEGK